jgi:hypothetical protein
MTRDDLEAETEDRHGGLAEDRQSRNFHNRQDIEMASLYSVNVNVLVRISQKVFSYEVSYKNSSPACPLPAFVTALRTSLAISEI